MKSLLQIFCLNEENEKIVHNLELFSSPQEWGEQQRPSYIFIRSGDGCGPFPESVTARRARRFIHQSSQLRRLFILPWRPTSEARPIKFSHFCPNACHSIRIGRKRSPCLALRPASHLSWSLPLCSITFLTSNEEWTSFRGEIMMCSPGQGCKWNAHFGAESMHRERRGCEGSQKKKTLIPHYRTSNIKARMFQTVHRSAVGLLPSPCAPAEKHGVHVVLLRGSGSPPNNVDSQIKLGTDLVPRSLFPPSSFSGHLKVVLVLLPVIPQTFSLIGIWWLKAILCFILALAEIVARPQIWHDNIRSPRRRTAASELRVSATALSSFSTILDNLL